MRLVSRNLFGTDDDSKKVSDVFQEKREKSNQEEV